MAEPEQSNLGLPTVASRDDLDPLTIEGFLARRSTTESTIAEYPEQAPDVRAAPRQAARNRHGPRPGDAQGEAPNETQRPRVRTDAWHVLPRRGRPDLAELTVMKQRLRVIRPEEVLTPKDVQAMIQASTTKRNAALLGVLWDTGGRISEVLSANLGDVRKSAPDDKLPLRFRLFFAQTKTDDPREAWVTDTARVLDGWIHAHPFADDPKAPLFANADGSRLSRKRAWALVVAAARRAKVGKKVWAHLFRHSRATYFLRIGVSEPNVKKLLGWSARSTQLARYGHLVSGDAYRAVLRAEGFTVPVPETVERITLEDDSLLPVVPVLPSGADRAERIRDDTELGRIAELLSDPEVRAFLARRLRASSASAPVEQ